MITAEGEVHIKRYLAGFVPNIAQSIAFGVGGKAEESSDSKMHFEVGRVDITLTSFDFSSNRLVFKAELPDDFVGTIYEAAIFSASANDAAGEFGSRMITSFDSDSEDWVDAVTGSSSTFSSVNNRIGPDSLRHTPAASTTKSDLLNQVDLDLSGYSGNDKFVFAFNVGNTNTSSLLFRFFTDASNHYSITLGAQTAGYKIVEVNKSAATVVGSPDWSNITTIAVATTSKSSGASQIDFDGIRMEDTDTNNQNYIMVSREALSSPFKKDSGMIQDIEFDLVVTVGEPELP